jgi:hypothetical protein
VKQSRRIATRYEKRGENYHAMWIVASILLWLALLPPNVPATVF